jgi:hypothetical protein
MKKKVVFFTVMVLWMILLIVILSQIGQSCHHPESLSTKFWIEIVILGISIPLQPILCMRAFPPKYGRDG